MMPDRSGIRTPLVVGATSHRNLVVDEIPALRRLVRELFSQLRGQFGPLPLQVLSALAEGGDRLVAEEALDLDAQLVAVLPMSAERYARDFVEPRSKAQFENLCNRAEIVQFPRFGDSLEIRGASANRREARYAAAGLYISSHCHILLALWDGRPSGLLGGTSQVVRYHLEGILPSSIERRRAARPLFDSGDESLLYHIPCSRAADDGEVQMPMASLRALEPVWLSQHGSQPAARFMPPDFELMFRRMVEFNVDAKNHAEAIESRRESDRPAPRADPMFIAADTLALHFQRRVHLSLRGMHALAALMGIALVCYSDLPGDLLDPMPLLYLFIALFAAGVALAALAGRRQWHRKYIDYRALAEGLRVQHFWREAGVSASGSVAFAHDNFMQKQDIELGWIRNVMRAVGIRASNEAETLPLDVVIQEWIGTVGKSGQLDYYTSRVKSRLRLHRTTEVLGRGCLFAGMGIAVFIALFHGKLSPDATNLLIALMGTLAIIAAARESYAWRKADKELIKQYRFMRHLYASARDALGKEGDPQIRREMLRALGEAALAEHAEWALLHRERPLEHGKP